MFEMFRFEKVQQQQEEEYGKLCLQVADDHFPDVDSDFESFSFNSATRKMSGWTRCLTTWQRWTKEMLISTLTSIQDHNQTLQKHENLLGELLFIFNFPGQKLNPGTTSLYVYR